MRLPNGYGSVYKLSGNRRKPWIARKTIGWDENGKQLYQTIGYYEKRPDALNALAEFNKNPYDMKVSTITFAEVFEKWNEGKYPTISKSNINGYNAAFKTSEVLHNIKFVEIRAKHMQDVIRTCGKGHGTLRKIKVLFNQLYKFAMENDIVTKDYSDYVDIGKNTEGSTRKSFTSKEIKRLFEVVDHIEFVDTILIMIYTGLRIGELLILENAAIDLDNRTIIGGIKTEAGKDRIVPISSKILPLVENRVSLNKYFLMNIEGNMLKYDNYYREKFIPIMEQLGMDHKPHDCRHTFATLMGNAGADTVALQKIIGHASYQTTANIYTHKDIEQLKKAIDLI
ncbi:Site-specific recombinase XerD [Natronincola peptidivorans]|uniref:Site-specific recombinase XerD n=1 Tax=Natronincola peptidivorans TaxID=426128 RepID=A0A1I0FEH3_9FIRM|nr:site-specific integrase [Natronincola peptidivorans]SET56542.1 Site-specific recombinase XerD [Natronincola peptidivorans]